MKSTTSSLIFEKAKAGYPAIYLQSTEDMRSLMEIKDAAKNLKRELWVWTLNKGWKSDTKTTYVPETDGPLGAVQYLQKIPIKSICVIRSFHHFLDDPGVQAAMIDAFPEFKKSGRTLVALTPVKKLPPELEKEFAFLETQLPDKEVLGVILDGIVTGSKFTGDMIPTPEQRKELIEAAAGLTCNEAENAFALAIVRPKLLGLQKTWDVSVVLEEKVAALKKTELLEYIPNKAANLKEVGGMEALKSWISKRKKAFSEDARKFGLPPPKGILLLGPPGGGKSLGAKAISGELGLPLIRCDMGRLFGGLVGQSEANTRLAIQIAEAVSPCILWLDEIEKGFAGSNAGSLDSGVGARVLGTFLTWMQEKTSSVFVYATANNIAALPPELLRKGRFDELFSVLLPDDEERQEILRIHILKRRPGSSIINNGKLNGIDLKVFSEMTDGFSGAEIEASIVEAMYSAFDRGGKSDLNGIDLEEAIKATNPLSRTMSEQLKYMEEWCRSRTRAANPRNASDKDKETVAAGSGGRNVDA